MSKNKPIIVQNLIKSYGNFHAVNNISFEVNQSEIFGFLGSNGAGKTTAIKILCGLNKPTSGKVIVNGFNVYKQSEKIKKTIGYMSQKFSLYEDLSIKENIIFFSGIYGLDYRNIRLKLKQILIDLDLQDNENKLVKSIPLGWKQKLAFSIAILHEPKIVFLDEPTGGVDPQVRRNFWEMIYQKSNDGITFFVTTHYMDEAEYCNRVSIMVDGKIADIGIPSLLKKKYNTNNFSDVFFQLARNSSRII